MAFSHINYAECIGDKFAISPSIILKVGRSLSKRVCFCFECEWMFHVLDEDNPLPGLDCFICRSEMNDLRHEGESEPRRHPSLSTSLVYVTPFFLLARVPRVFSLFALPLTSRNALKTCVSGPPGKQLALRDTGITSQYDTSLPLLILSSSLR